MREHSILYSVYSDPVSRRSWERIQARDEWAMILVARGEYVWVPPALKRRQEGLRGTNYPSGNKQQEAAPDDG